MMSRSQPLAPSEQRKYLNQDVAMTEGLIETISTTIQDEKCSFRRDPASQPKSLANFIIQFQLYMDEVLGAKSNSNDRYAVKIPAVFFRDFAHPNGVLKHIIVWSLELKQKETYPSSRRFELSLEKNSGFAKALVQQLWKNLLREQFFTPPRVYFWVDPSDKNMQFDAVSLITYKNIIKRHGGFVTEDIKESTHIVLPLRVINFADIEVYFRPLEQRGSKIFVHWWYYPDSYDCWTKSHNSYHEASHDPVIPPEDGKWKVGLEWVEKLEYYNEWMNEGDFEIEELPASFHARSNAVPNMGPPEDLQHSSSCNSISVTDRFLSKKTQSFVTATKRKRGRPPRQIEDFVPTIQGDSMPSQAMNSSYRFRKRAFNTQPGRFVVSFQASFLREKLNLSTVATDEQAISAMENLPSSKLYGCLSFCAIKECSSALTSSFSSFSRRHRLFPSLTLSDLESEIDDLATLRIGQINRTQIHGTVPFYDYGLSMLTNCTSKINLDSISHSVKPNQKLIEASTWEPNNKTYPGRRFPASKDRHFKLSAIEAIDENGQDEKHLQSQLCDAEAYLQSLLFYIKHSHKKITVKRRFLQETID